MAQWSTTSICIIPSNNTPKPLPSLCFLLIITPVTCPAESLNPHRVLFFTVDVLPVADVLQVASRLLPAQIRLLVVRLQPGVSISAELWAGGHAARGRAPHLYPSQQRGSRWVLMILFPPKRWVTNPTEASRSPRITRAHRVHPYSSAAGCLSVVEAVTGGWICHFHR